MTTFETLRLLAVIVAIFSVPAAIFWYLIDRKLKQMEKRYCDYLNDFLFDVGMDIATINNQLNNIK